MNYFDPIFDIPRPDHRRCLESQVKEAETLGGLPNTLTEVATSFLLALRRVTLSCAPYPAVRGAPSSVSSLASNELAAILPGTCSKVDDDASTGWPGALAVSCLYLAARAWARGGDGGNYYCHQK